MNDTLPLECPYCEKEFDTAQGVDSHFAFNSGHPMNMCDQFKSQIQTAIENSSENEGFSEQNIIDEWAKSAYPNEWYLTEVPISTVESNSIKKADILVVTNSYPITLNEFVTNSIQRSNSLNTSGEDRVRTLFSQLKENAINVRIFEAKKKLNFKSIGQILSYSELLPAYYGEEIDINVVEKGIIFAEGDPFCRSVAEKYNIQLSQVDI